MIQNSANIIVQNRLTGQLEEEKMQVYVRLGIRLLYKGSILGDIITISAYLTRDIRVLGERWRVREVSRFIATAISTLTNVTARRLLKSMSIKQGLKYDSPESKHDIQSFVQFYDLNVDEILEPIESFRT